MKCPKCNKEGFRYIEREKKKVKGKIIEVRKRSSFKAKKSDPRISNIARCRKCGYEGKA